jgi:UDP-glucuronate decarboxylase
LEIHLETRAIVTGGGGFLGSHLCERLLMNGANIICVDNFFTSTRRNIDRSIANRLALGEG